MVCSHRPNLIVFSLLLVIIYFHFTAHFIVILQCIFLHIYYIIWQLMIDLEKYTNAISELKRSLIAKFESARAGCIFTNRPRSPYRSCAPPQVLYLLLTELSATWTGLWSGIDSLPTSRPKANYKFMVMTRLISYRRFLHLINSTGSLAH